MLYGIVLSTKVQQLESTGCDQEKSVMPTEMRGEGGIKAGERPDLRRYGNPRFWPEITWYKGISSEVEASIDACYARAVDYWLSGEEAK